MTDPVREFLSHRMAELDLTESGVSTAIGKNWAYLNQYLKRGVPKNLPEDVRYALAAYLRVDESKLRAPNQQPKRSANSLYEAEKAPLPASATNIVKDLAYMLIDNAQKRMNEPAHKEQIDRATRRLIALLQSDYDNGEETTRTEKEQLADFILSESKIK